MSANLLAFPAIIVVALILLMTRLSGAEFVSKLRLTPKAEQFLDSMAGSVLVAIIMNEIIKGGVRALTATILTVVLMRLFKKPTFAMLFGVGYAAMVTLGGGWLR